MRSLQTHRAASSSRLEKFYQTSKRTRRRRQFLGNARADFPEALAGNPARDSPGIFANLGGTERFYNGSKLRYAFGDSSIESQVCRVEVHRCIYNVTRRAAPICFAGI